MGVRLLLLALAGFVTDAASFAAESVPVEIDSDGWRLHGSFTEAAAGGAAPAALLLHRAAGTRQEYAALAAVLAECGISSLALDLRGHGDSVNLGRFEEPYAEHLHINEDVFRDVLAGLDWLSAREGVDAGRLAVVGASYSGEAAGLALREGGRLARAYIMLSPGNFSDPSIVAARDSGARWLFVRSVDESPAAKPHIDGLFEALASLAPALERRVLDGSGHATRLFDDRADLNETLADWLAAALER